jgi:hypothetical protein
METIKETTRLLLQGTLTKDEADKILLDLLVVSDCQFESYATFCIECDRQGLKPIKYRDYLEIG